MAEFRIAVRRLRKRPLPYALSFLAIAVGTGTLATVFSIYNLVLGSSLQLPKPEQLVVLSIPVEYSASGPRVASTLVDSGLLSSIGLFFSVEASIDDGTGPSRAPAAIVDAGFFKVLSVKPQSGRTFLQSDDNFAPLVVISERLSARLAKTSGGPQTIRVGVRSLEVVGIIPDHNAFPRECELWLLPGTGNEIREQLIRYTVVGRVKDGLTLDQVSAAARASIPSPYTPVGRKPVVDSLQSHTLGDQGKLIPFLLSLAILAFASSCAAVYGLWRDEVLRLAHDTSVQVAVGASDYQIIRQFLAQFSVPLLFGASTGLLGASYYLHYWLSYNPRDGAAPEADVATAVTIATITLAVCVLLPVMLGIRKIREPISWRIASGRSARPWEAMLQVAGAVIFLLTTTVFIQARGSILPQELGLANDRAVTLKVYLPLSGYPLPEDIGRFARDVEQRISEHPGILSVGVVDRLPTEGQPAAVSLIRSTNGLEVEAVTISATDGYFRAAGIEVDTVGDPISDDAQPIYLSNDAASRLGLQAEAGVTYDVSMESGPSLRRGRIVGIAGGVAYFRRPWPAAYLRIEDAEPASRNLTVVVLAQPGVDARRVAVMGIAQLDPRLPTFDHGSIGLLSSHLTRHERSAGWLIVMIAAMAILQSVISLYGTLHERVRSKVSELAVRMTLGLEPTRAAADVVRASLRLVLVAILPGLVCSVLAIVAARTALPDLEIPQLTDVLTTVAIVVVIALGASANLALAVYRLPVWQILKDESTHGRRVV